MTYTNNNNISKMSTSKIIEVLTNSYSKLILQNLALKLMPTVMLWGPPGVGKSQAVYEMAKGIEKQTLKKVNVTDVRLILFNPIDLRGIPTSDSNKEFSIWLKPKIFDMDESADVVNILFLDELSAAPPSVQAASYQIALDRKIGEHKLPDNCIVLTAGNRVQDGSVAYKMPKALSNRLLHFDVDINFNSWKKWAIDNNINQNVIDFLSFDSSLLSKFDPTSDELAFPSPRSWEMVSNILNYIEPSVDKAYKLICGIVGKGVATEFRTWDKEKNLMPNVEKIFRGENPLPPEREDQIKFLINSMVAYAKDHKDDELGFNNSLVYAFGLPRDFAKLLVEKYKMIDDDFKNKIEKSNIVRSLLK